MSVVTVATLDAPPSSNSSSDGWCVGWGWSAGGFVSVSTLHSASGLLFVCTSRECVSYSSSSSSQSFFSLSHHYSGSGSHCDIRLSLGPSTHCSPQVLHPLLQLSFWVQDLFSPLYQEQMIIFCFFQLQWIFTGDLWETVLPAPFFWILSLSLHRKDGTVGCSYSSVPFSQWLSSAPVGTTKEAFSGISPVLPFSTLNKLWVTQTQVIQDTVTYWFLLPFNNCRMVLST